MTRFPLQGRLKAGNTGLLICLIALGCFATQGAAFGGDVANAAAVPADSNEVSILLGYSFGLANNPFRDASPTTDNSASANEPLLGFFARLGPDQPVHLDLTLAMANFGRLVGLVKGQEASPANGVADVRRSILVDATIGARLATFSGSCARLFLSGNVGFVFDAQADQGNSVEDASSYLMVGPTLQARFGKGSSLALDLFAGPSEVMTNREIFSSAWRFRDTRIRPRILFALDSRDNSKHADKNSFFDGKFMFGLWADLGMSKDFGDTYALFISRSIADFR